MSGIPGKKSASWQRQGRRQGPQNDAKRQKTTQKCQNWLKIKGNNHAKICPEILVPVDFRIFPGMLSGQRDDKLNNKEAIKSVKKRVIIIVLKRCKLTINNLNLQY